MATYPIPLGDQGLYGGHNLARLPPEYLLKAESICFDDGTIRKEGGAAIYNSRLSPAFTERTNAKNIALNGVAWGSLVHVAVGAADGTDSYILTSSDSITWTERAPTVAKNIALNDVIFWPGAASYIAVGDGDGTDSYILTASSFGATWTEQAPTVAKNIALNGVTYSATLAVAVGAADGTDSYILTSPDITTWTERAPTVAKNIALNDVIWVQQLSLYVAVGAADGTDAYILTSPDGITWTEQAPTVAKNFGLNSIEWNGSILVAVGVADGTDAYILTSADGTTWTERANPKNFALNSVIWLGNVFCAGGGADGTDGYLILSSDGISWYEIANPKNFAINGLSWNGVDVAFVGGADGTDAYIGSMVQTSGFSEKSNPKNFDLNSVVFAVDNGIYVAVGAADGTDAYIVTSADASTWTERSNPKNITLNELIYTPGKLAAVGEADGTNAYILTSPDGITWTERTNPKNFALNSIDYNGLLYVAVGDADGTDAYLITSQDAVNWTERTNPKNFDLLTVKWISNLNLWVAAGISDGADAYLITSPDGITWTERSSSINLRIDALAANGDYIVGIGATVGAMIRSTDGITWSSLTGISSLRQIDGKHILWNGIFFAIIGGGSGDSSIFISYETDVWVELSSGSGSKISALWDGEKLLQVGAADGTDAYIETLPFSSQAKFLGGVNWDYNGSNSKVVALDSQGRLLMDDYDGVFDAVLTSGLTVTSNTFPVFVEGGKEVAANNKKLFIFTGANIVQVLSGAGTSTANLTTPPADWTGATQPTGGLIHKNRLWGYGNSNDPHRLYYSGTASHEDFSAGGSLSVYPGEGDKIVNAISYKGYIIVFKYPKGIYVIDTTPVSTTAWAVDRVNEKLGGAGQGSAAVVEEDIVFIDHTGEIRLVAGITEFGDIGSKSFSDMHDISVFIRDTYYLPSNTKWRMAYYSKKRELHIGASSNYLGINDHRMVVDFNRSNPRFRNSTRDTCLYFFLRELNGVPELMACDNLGYIWRMDQDTKSKDGQGYNSQFQLTYTDLGSPGVDKGGQFISIDFEPTDTEVAIDVIWDGVYQETTTIDLSAELEVQPGRLVLTKQVPLNGSGDRVSLIFRNNNAGEDYAIQGLRILHTGGSEEEEP